MEFILISVGNKKVILSCEERERKVRLKKLKRFMNKNNMNDKERSRYIDMLEKFKEI